MKSIIRQFLYEASNLLRFWFLKFSHKERIVVVLGSQFKNAHGIINNLILATPVPSDFLFVVLCDDLPCDKGGNITFINKWSLKHIYYALVADFYIVSHKVRDVFFVKPKGVFLINFWHGFPYKPIGFSSKIETEWIKCQIKNYNKCEYDDWDVLVGYSQLHCDIMKKVTGNRCGSYNILGNPNINALYNVINLSGKRKVLYCPTFRLKGELNLKGVEDFINMAKKYSDDYDFILKLHPLLKSDDLAFSGCVSTYEGDVYDILPLVDMVVTDYSSLIFDALSTKGFVILYQYDYDDYINELGSTMLDVSLINGCYLAYNIEELNSLIRDYDSLPLNQNFGFEYQHLYDSKKLLDVLYENYKAS